MIRTLHGIKHGSLQQGHRIVKVAGQKLTAEQILGRLTREEQQPVAITCWETKQNFASNLRQYMRLSADIVGFSYLEEDAIFLRQWQEAEFIFKNPKIVTDRELAENGVEYLRLNQSPGST